VQQILDRTHTLFGRQFLLAHGIVNPGVGCLHIAGFCQQALSYGNEDLQAFGSDRTIGGRRVFRHRGVTVQEILLQLLCFADRGQGEVTADSQAGENDGSCDQDPASGTRLLLFIARRGHRCVLR
jgi:hypothetical protein